MPTVVNRHRYGVRKGRPPFPEPYIYIGRGTPLGNPFSVAQNPDCDRSMLLVLYRRWLWDQIRAGNGGVLRALRKIRPETHLVCSCAPKPCHGDVVIAAWKWLRARKFDPVVKIEVGGYDSGRHAQRPPEAD